MTKRRSVRWFLLAGCVGIAIAIMLALSPPSNPLIIVLLWPASIVGLADPTTIGAKMLIGSFEFGGNFLLYGMLGAIAGAASDSLH
jgi:hypothetical protein